MEQNDRHPFSRFHIVLADIVGVDRVMLDLSHDGVLSRRISTAGNGAKQLQLWRLQLSASRMVAAMIGGER
jgi:hypothetical protein